MNTSSFSSKRLIEERNKLKLTQAQAAKLCGVSTRMWGDYERGKSQPKAETLFLFEKAGIDVGYVMYGQHGVRLGAALEGLPKPGDAIASLSALSEWTDEEQELLTLFRAADDLGRAVILAAARGAGKKAATPENRQAG